MEKEVLDKFGELLIEAVRDRTINEIDSVISGKSTSKTANYFNNQMKSILGSNDILQTIIPIAVDFTINNFINLFEESDLYDISYQSNNGWMSVSKLSDGLSGELFGKRGWIKRFSKQRYTE
jgi:hypothetical protein